MSEPAGRAPGRAAAGPQREDDPRGVHHCPLCGGAARHARTMPIDAKTFRPTPFGRVHACGGCGFEFIAPRPTPEQTARFYDIGGYYTQGGAPAAPAGRPGWSSRLRTHLAWRVDRSRDLVDVVAERLPRGAALLDIGAGDGTQLRLLSQRGFAVTGVERDAKSLSLQGDVEVPVLEGSAEALPPQLAPASFDGVMFKQVLEHLVDPVAALRHAAALLKPGGVMVVEVPNHASAIAESSGLAWEHMDVPRHLNFFTATTLRDAVARAGLAVESTFFNEYCRWLGDAAIAADAAIYDHLGGAGPARRHGAARAWWLLARTAFAAPERKYDCVGVVAVRPA